jgi:hypothetical protein
MEQGAGSKEQSGKEQRAERMEQGVVTGDL